MQDELTTQASIASGYRWRLIIIALGCLGWASWCVKDATVTYPEQIERREFFVAYQDANPEWATTWPETAASKGWPIEEPTDRSQGDILTQWLMFGLTAPIGLYCLSLVLIWQGRYLGSDEEAIYSHGNRKAKWDQITRIDASRWEIKGIARVYYDDGSGERQILVDDWKFEREPTTAVYQSLKDHVDQAKFEGLEEDDETEELDDGVTEDASVEDSKSTDDMAGEPAEDRPTKAPTASP
ncbi:MAG: hypothetical protein AAGC44_02310 [Planctomycetota bacterium]